MFVRRATDTLAESPFSAGTSVILNKYTSGRSHADDIIGCAEYAEISVMCGIAGFVGCEDVARARNAVATMTDDLKRRGPNAKVSSAGLRPFSDTAACRSSICPTPDGSR